VRWLFLWALGAAMGGLVLPAGADDTSGVVGTINPPGNPASADTSPEADDVVQEFSGGGTTTTGLFTVQDRWEVRWNAKAVVSVAVLSKDGAIVAGAAGVLRGSLFVPLGGQYYLKVSDGTAPPPAPTPPVPAPVPAPDVSTNAPPAALTNAPSAATTNAPPLGGTNAAPVAPTNAPTAGTNAAPVVATNAPPAVVVPEPAPAPAPAPEVVVTWHLQIVQLAKAVSADQALTVYTPYFTMPDAAVTPVLAPPPVPPPVLSDDETHTIVSIKGDNAQGDGFLMRSPDGTFVVTHLHLLAANPNVKLFTSSGEAITVLGLKGAVDRDLAMFSIQDNNYAYLPAPADPAPDLQAGDQLIIPDIGAEAGVLAGKLGRLVGMSPERIDFDNGMGLGSSGAPVIHVKSGTVLGIVTTQKQVDVSDRLAQAWAANPAPGSSAIIPYYGLRLSGVTGWETYDAQRFLEETLFLRQFHDNTRYLDSYLNGRRNRGPFGDVGNEHGPPDNKYFLKNIKLSGDQDTYHQQATDADENQRLDAARELLSDLQSFAGTNFDTLQGMTGLYAYDQAWAREEIAYRRALKKELDDLGNNIVRFDAIARSR
jgi:hypothetical protein